MNDDNANTTDTLPAAEPTAGAVDRPTIVRGVVILIAVAIVGFGFAWSYVGALHRPTFHHVPLAVVGPRSLSRELSHSPQFSVVAVRSRASAVSAIDQQRAFGAIVAGPSGITILTASAASAAVATALSTTLPSVLHAAAGAAVPITVTDVKPLPASDPTGLTSFYLSLALIVGNYLGAVFFGMAFGTRPVGRRVWFRLLGVGIIALLLALAEVAVVVAFGPFRGHYPLLVLAGLLLGITVSMVTIGCQMELGILGMTAAVFIFVVLGNPASSGPIPTQLLPGIWRWIGPYLPAGAGVSLIRSIVYFGGSHTTRPLLVLFTWLAAAVLLVGLASRELWHGQT
jgi:hypothetical protein